MKKYYINMRNGWRMFLDIGQHVCFIVMIIAICVWSYKLTKVLAIFEILFFVPIGIIIVRILVGMIYNCIYYDEKTDELILHRLRSKDRRIAFSDIEKIVPKRNDDITLGSYKNKYNSTYAVKSRDGYDYFFISDCPVLMQFFKEHGIPTVERDEELS